MRHEIGVETILFGRDYPHPEGTWPHTREWLRDAFAGVPEDELRLMLGENAIRFFGLDRDRLAEIAKRIGPTVEEIIGGGEVGPELIENFAMRGGYLKPAEGEAKLPLVDEAAPQGPGRPRCIGEAGDVDHRRHVAGGRRFREQGLTVSERTCRSDTSPRTLPKTRPRQRSDQPSRTERSNRCGSGNIRTSPAPVRSCTPERRGCPMSTVGCSTRFSV